MALLILAFIASFVAVLPGEAAPLPQGPYYKVYGNYIAREGQTVTMDCHLTEQLAIVGFLSSTEWVKDGKVIAGQTSTRLTQYHVTRQDAGHYQCGEPGSDLHRMGLDLHVFVVGDVLPRPDVIKQYDSLAVLGRPYSLQCIIRGTTYIANEATVYTWYKDSVEVKGQTGALLLLPNVTQADEGKYRCTAREGPVESMSPASFDYYLTVFVSPQVRIKPSGPVVRGILGESLTLTCEVTRAEPYVPKDGYSWSYLPYPEAEQRPLKGKQRTLTLGALTLEDRGQYFCQARNDQLFDYTKMSGHASVTVDVVYLENITLTPDVIVNKGDRVTLTCGVDSHPTARLTWTVNGREVRHVTDDLDHYVIMSAACSDSTNYTCGASNTEMPGWERNATTRVHVHCKQVAEEDRERDSTPTMAKTEVTATLHFSLPQMTSSVVVVHPSGRDIISVHQDYSLHVTPAFLPRCLQPRCDLEHHHLTFTLTQVTEEDEGNYTCVEEGRQTPVSNCGTQLLVQKDVAQSGDHNSTSFGLGLVSTVLLLIGMLVGVALAIKFCGTIQNVVKHLTSMLIKRHLKKPKDKEMNFDGLYKKGRVYVFPRLFSPENRTAPSFNDDTGDESHPLLGQPEVKEEEVKFKVKDLLRFTLQKFMSANQEDLPSFVLHNKGLSKQENVTLVVDRKIGVVVVVTKLIQSSRSSSLQEAEPNLLQARDAVMHKLQDLVQPCDVTAVLSLPCLTSDDVKKLSTHLGIVLLPGLDKASYQQWMEDLRREKTSKVWRSSSQGGDYPDTVYKMAASRFLTLAGCGGPGEFPPNPDPAQSWLLTPAQVEVRDSTARLLHVWGPPGSGKTTLLVHRARQWLAEGKMVLLTVGWEFYKLKLTQISEAMKMGQTKEAIGKLRVCRTHQEAIRTLKEMRGECPDVDICIVVDIFHRDMVMFRKMLSLVRSQQPVYILSTWRRNLHDINAELSNEAIQLGWESIKLPDCIRCTKDTVELLNLLGKDVYPPIPSCSLPRDPDIPAQKVVDHCLHPDHVNTVSRCDGCKTEMSQVLPSMEEVGPWKAWIALCTGNMHISINLADLQQALRHLGVPASCDSSVFHREEDASTTSAPRQTASASDSASIQECVIKGGDREGQPVVHLVEIEDFRGMEKDKVILVHYDKRDNDPKCQSQADRDTRLKEHRSQWMHAVSRSKGQVILLLLTPSPARSLLGLPEPVMAKRQDASESAPTQMDTHMQL